MSPLDEDPRTHRLPAWARQQINALREQVGYRDEAIAKLQADLAGDLPGTRVHVRDYVNPDRPLPDDSKITFKFDPRAQRGADVIVYFDERGTLTVQCDSAVNIMPQASNCFRLELRS